MNEPKKSETPKEALKNAIEAVVTKKTPEVKPAESPRKVAADAIANFVSPVSVPATLAVSPVSPAALQKQHEITALASNPIVQVQKAVEQKKHESTSKDVPKKKSHWFMDILHSIGNAFSWLFSWGSKK